MTGKIHYQLASFSLFLARGLTTASGILLAGNPQPADPPDPVDLLKSVATARLKINSGELEFNVARIESSRALKGTNHLRLKAVFEGEHRRFDALDREYSYVMMGPDAAKVTDAKMVELGLDQEGAVRAGLLTGFESHRVSAYDGSALLNYGETDGNPFQTEISDPAQGSIAYVFDPRILGLTPMLFPTSTIESCLAYGDAKSVKLEGQETVDGVAAWHVRVMTKWNMTSDFWMDASQPTHVIKCEYNGDAVVSKFDATNPGDPIPIDVLAVSFRGRERSRSDHHFVRGKARFNVSIDPVSWTLPGLNMAIGTPVVDVRIQRRIGYWDGTGLARDLPKTSRPVGESRTPPNPRALLALAEKDPTSLFALISATWVILNTPDGPEVERAAGIILQNHVQSNNLVYLCQELTNHLRPHAAAKLLRAVLDKNPSAEVRANACFALATLLKDQSNGGDENAAEEAGRLFDLVISDYGQITAGGTKLAVRAESELVELRKLAVGREAPEIEGESLEGLKMKLSDYRGKVVVLVFWGTWCGPCMAMVPDERKLTEDLAGRPFALIGINSDKNPAKVKDVAAREKMTWPSFRDAEAPGPIARAWNVHSWPTIYVLDRSGVIRYRNVRGHDLSDAVNKLLL